MTGFELATTIFGTLLTVAGLSALAYLIRELYRKPKDQPAYKPTSYENEVVQFILAHPHHKHYVVAKTFGEVIAVAVKVSCATEFPELPPTIEYLSLAKATAGWRAPDGNYALSCVSDIHSKAVLHQLYWRLPAKGSPRFIMFDGVPYTPTDGAAASEHTTVGENAPYQKD